MTTSIDNACQEIVNVLNTITGIAGTVPINPNETQNSDLFALAFPEEGVISAEPIGSRLALHDIAIYLMKRRIDQATDLSVIKPFIDTVPAALLAEVSTGGTRFNNTISTFGNITYKYEFLIYAGVEFTCYHFIMHRAKILVNN